MLPNIYYWVLNPSSDFVDNRLQNIVAFILHRIGLNWTMSGITSLTLSAIMPWMEKNLQLVKSGIACS